MWLTACHPFGTSNLESPSALTSYTPAANITNLWTTNVGSGTDDLGLRFAIGYANGVLYTTDASGDVYATNAQDGSNVWQVSVDKNITAGVGVGNGIVVVGTSDGTVIALSAKTGKQLWLADVGNQMLAPAQISNNIVVVKTVADKLIALDSKSGHQVWNFITEAPTLILRLGSTPQIADGTVYTGFASGRLVALNLQLGTIRWQKQIATPQGVNDVQQMIDIDADPVLRSQRVYVATYQGRIAALNTANGQGVWDHSISTYTGLDADVNSVFVTDAKGHIWSFAARTGQVNWLQKKLQARILSAPALLGNYLLVGDAEGYLHVIDKQTGQFATRVEVSDADAISSKPIVAANHAYVLTNNGELAGYQITRLPNSKHR
jgi:outer membrane protein assembly factor BamB